MSITE